MLHLCALPSQTQISSLTTRKDIRQMRVEKHSTKYLTSASQNCPDHEKQEKTEQILQVRET